MNDSPTSLKVTIFYEGSIYEGILSRELTESEQMIAELKKELSSLKQQVADMLPKVDTNDGDFTPNE